MAGIVQFLRRFPDDEACLHELAKLKWPNGFVCSKCDHTKGYHLKIGIPSPGEVAVENLPFTHTMFSNIKAWLNGTHHGVSKKHLPRYVREWNYRFNRRKGDVVGWVLGRMATKPGITYGALTA